MLRTENDSLLKIMTEAMNKTDRTQQVQHVRGGGDFPHINKTLIYDIGLSDYLNRIINLHMYTLYLWFDLGPFPSAGPQNGFKRIDL